MKKIKTKGFKQGGAAFPKISKQDLKSLMGGKKKKRLM
jgi:hypothetical protein